MYIHLPAHVQNALQKLNNAGHAAYVVGGCVRDTIMGRVPNDWDITTDALPEEIFAVFAQDRVIPTGLQHGTVTVMSDGKPLEITTYRIDGDYADNRRPSSVCYTRSLQEDLLRRDFTVNAMAYHPKEGIVDCYSGLADLSEKRLVCVGNPEKRFTEDALRILRALRFSSQFGFKIEKMTAKAIHKLAPLLRRISAERIQSELTKILCGAHVKRVMLDFSDVLCVILPEITPMIGLEQKNPYHFLTVYEHTVETIDAIEPDAALRLTMLFHDCGKPACYTKDENGIDHFSGHAEVSASLAEQALKRLRYDRHTTDIVKTLVLHHDDTVTLNDHTLKKLLNHLGAQLAHKLISVQKADVMGQHPDKRDRLDQLDAINSRLTALVESNACFALKSLAVDGDDLIKIGYPSNERLGTTLQQLLDEVIADKLPNERNTLLKHAKGML